ncbi:hypothetical protein JCGZ_08906 [Jatropha curcas]|uniref:Uncharacterized protein n=1 Tax=Jatropha curcas TaxID=180498 RepID=A0A067KNC9_JATCU|nr:hypothetical protein JCGZ_08906 [Jatropha curcas]
MARGRAFDSDTSCSGSRGGRGLGRSTHGRGGTIPPTSSVSGPVQSSPAAQSPTVQVSPDPHNSLSLGNYTIARKRLVSSQTESEAESRIDEVALYLEAVGGKKKRKVYGIGSQALEFYCGSASHTSAGSTGPQLEHSAEEFTALWARVDDQ